MNVSKMCLHNGIWHTRKAQSSVRMPGSSPAVSITGLLPQPTCLPVPLLSLLPFASWPVMPLRCFAPHLPTPQQN